MKIKTTYIITEVYQNEIQRKKLMDTWFVSLANVKVKAIFQKFYELRILKSGRESAHPLKLQVNGWTQYI